jgi:hypothetical protein
VSEVPLSDAERSEANVCARAMSMLATQGIGRGSNSERGFLGGLVVNKERYRGILPIGKRPPP